jgi:hypothetical protein
VHAVVMITFPFANFSSTPSDIAGCEEGSCWSEEFRIQTESENDDLNTVQSNKHFAKLSNKVQKYEIYAAWDILSPKSSSKLSNQPKFRQSWWLHQRPLADHKFQ